MLDDDTGFLTVLSRRAEAIGMSMSRLDGAASPAELVGMKLDALLFDPAILGEAGWGYLEGLCEHLPSLGLIVCTQRSTLSRRVLGLRAGVDDWITKPVHAEEAVARVEAIVRGRRSRALGGSGSLVLAELEIRPEQFQAFAGGTSLGLTRREFEVLSLLARESGQVLQREAIYQRVWGYEMAHGDRSVDVFIRKLRHKLQTQGATRCRIHTHFGIGYRFELEPADSPSLETPPEVIAAEPIKPAVALT